MHNEVNLISHLACIRCNSIQMGLPGFTVRYLIWHLQVANIILLKTLKDFHYCNTSIFHRDVTILIHRQPIKIMAYLTCTSDWFQFVTFIMLYELYKSKPVTWEKVSYAIILSGWRYVIMYVGLVHCTSECRLILDLNKICIMLGCHKNKCRFSYPGDNNRHMLVIKLLP